MIYQCNLSQSSKAVINFALLFFWILFSLVAYLFFATIFALITGQAIIYRAVIVLFGTSFGLFIAVTGLLQTVNHYNRIRVTEDGLYVEVYVFRYVWKFVGWNEVVELKLLPSPDRWRKPQWLLRVTNLTYWHRWVSWYHGCGSEPGIVINSDLIGRDTLLDIIEEKLSRMRVETRKK